MQAGKLRQRITIERATETRDAFGATLQSWGTLATVWAEVLPKAAGEEFTSDAASERTSQGYTINLRYRSDVTTMMRVNWQSKLLDIESVADPDGRRRALRLECKERR
ncbi:MAG: head-tail adaptor protein [Desulfurellales bacterium]|nr:MAG: head-tail adaptor protein [Desulfurellales bacterium]